MSESRQQSSHRTRKIAAIAAGLLVVGVGATYTLASWTDSEWVWGGANGAPGIGTSSFEVQQNTTTDFSLESTGWVDEEANPGGELVFSAGALSLSPGDAVYAPVALRTVEDSVAAAITLQEAMASQGVTVSDTDGELWDAIELDVYTHSVTGAAVDPVTACEPGFDSTGWSHIVDADLNTPGSGPQSLAADRGSVQHY